MSYDIASSQLFSCFPVLNIVRSFDQISQKILKAVVVLNGYSVPLKAFQAYISSD